MNILMLATTILALAAAVSLSPAYAVGLKSPAWALPKPPAPGSPLQF
jgi:hypothetical protein